MAQPVLVAIRQAIETSFDDPEALDALEHEAEAADLDDGERNEALGLIDTYRADAQREVDAEKMAQAEIDPDFEFEIAPEDVVEEGLLGASAHAFNKLLHPRNRIGEFRDVAGKADVPKEHPGSLVLDTFIPQHKTVVLERSMAWRRAKLRPGFVRQRGTHGDEFMYELATDLGYASRPKKGSEAEVQQAISAGGVSLFRGLSDHSYADKLLGGPYFAGQGYRGNGIYTATHRTKAIAYATAIPNKGIAARSEHPVVLHMALHPRARIAEFEDLRRSQRMELERLRLVIEDESLPEPQRREARILYDIALDAGRFAMTQGYDAVRVKEDEINVLNRSALLVSTEFEDAGENLAQHMLDRPGVSG